MSQISYLLSSLLVFPGTRVQVGTKMFHALHKSYIKFYDLFFPCKNLIYYNFL